jgi:flagellar motor switch protein FliN/FliY
MSFRVSIKDLVDSEMMQLIPLSFAKNMVADLMAANGMNAAPPPKPKAAKKEKAADPPKIAAEQPRPPEPQREYVMPSPLEPQPPREQVVVSPVEYARFSPEPLLVTAQPNLDLIMDVGLQLSVELGRTHKKIKEILELAQGSILELDKLAGEPVDILINGKLLAKGEVVVIDEKFGVRVTEIISPLERVRKLG